ncbi:MAG: type VI secretion system Vgr family protein [Pseudomonadota bacterium]
MKLEKFLPTLQGPSDANRPIRLRLTHADGVADDLLLVKQVSGVETMFGGLQYQLRCVSTRFDLEMKQFIAMPVELQFVTDSGGLRLVCGIVEQAIAGEADGGLATYQLTVRDALAIMEKDCGSRVFHGKNEAEITEIVLTEWRHDNPVLARAFDFDLTHVKQNYPRREFTRQYNESSAAFLRRLWKRRGLAWFVRPGRATERGSDATPAHTLVLFDDPYALLRNAAGTVRFRRDDGTQARDSITAWQGVRTLTAGNVTRRSWDYKTANLAGADIPGMAQQGTLGDQFAGAIDDYLIDSPHAGDNADDYKRLSTLRMLHHEYVSQCYQGDSGVRAMCVGESLGMTGHPDIDSHPVAEREFVITELRVEAENNLPKTLGEHAQRLFALNGWDSGALVQADAERGARYANQFTCVRRGVPIVPLFDPRVDVPRAEPFDAVVIGPVGEEIHCDNQGRVLVRIPGCRTEERDGSLNCKDGITPQDSAWLRISTALAGEGFGAQFLPHKGNLVRVSHQNGDPDRPIITGAVHGGTTPSPRFSHVSVLPGDRYLSGVVSKEVHGRRHNQLRIDNTPGEISVQLASDHGASQLNLGYLTDPRENGRATPRGDGFELSTLDSGSIRTAKSLLISAWKRLDGGGKQLSSQDHLALMQDCLDLFKTLGQYAAEHQGLAPDPAPQAALKDDVSAAAGGGNTDPQGQGGKPTISLTAPAGIALSTPKTIVSYAGANIDMGARFNMQWTCGQDVNVNAGKGICLFAHKNGIAQIAHYGRFLMQSQHDDMQIDSGKDLKITAAGSVTIMAEQLHLIAKDGSHITIGGGVVLGTDTNIQHHAANVTFSGPATKHTEMPYFSAEGKDPAHWIALHYLDPQTAQGLAGAPYAIHFDGGPTVTGKLDENGKAKHQNVMNLPVEKVVYLPRTPQKEQDAGPLHELDAA